MVEVINVNNLEGEKVFGTPYKNLYILNSGSEGLLIINDTYTIDIRQIDLLEDINIYKIKWKLTTLGSLTLFLSNSYLKLRDMIVKVEEVADVNVQNSYLPVKVEEVADVNVQNSYLPVKVEEVAGVNVQNSYLPIKVEEVAEVNVQNSYLPTYKERNAQLNGVVPISTEARDDNTSTVVYTNTGTKNAYVFDVLGSLHGSDPSEGRVAAELYDPNDNLIATFFNARLEQTANYETIFASHHYDPPIVVPPDYYVKLVVYAGSGETAWGCMTIMEDVT